MAFTFANIEGVKHNSTFDADQAHDDDWRALVNENTKKDEISMTQEYMRELQKKENYKKLLDDQNKYISNLKNGKRKNAQESNMAERMLMNNQYAQETDKEIGQRMKSMEKQQQINNLNKQLHSLKSRHQSQNKYTEGGSFKENPIEYRLRNDFLRKREENKVREHDIMEYNTNISKMHKMKQLQKKEKDKYYSKEYNDLIETQAVNHIINRTSQQEKYETKRQQSDFIVLRTRTLSVKKTIDDLISQYQEMSQGNSSEMRELLEMQSTLRKWLMDIERGDQMKPTSLDSLMREVHSKNNVILDWQIHDKKITAIENKLKDKEYYKYVKSLADEETSLINQQYQVRKEKQQQYLSDLQKQEKHYKQLRKDEDSRMNPKEKLINGRKVGMNGSRLEVTSMISSSSRGRLSSDHTANQTIDVNQYRQFSPKKHSSAMATINIPNSQIGR